MRWADIVMPGMSGRALAEKLAVMSPSIKALFASGYTSDEIVRHGITETAMNFIQKPHTFDAIAHKIREAIDEPSL